MEAVLDRLWGGAKTAIVVRSDLSHYLEPAAARRLDQATSGAITGLRPEAIDPGGRLRPGPGPRPAQGGPAARAAVQPAGPAQLGRHRPRGPGRRPGPGGGLRPVRRPERPPLPPGHRRLLLEIAAGSIRHGLATGRPLAVDLAGLPPEFAAPRATFVTLHLDGELRGCVGRLEAALPLAQDLADNAFAAAFLDRRFPPVTEAGARHRLSLSLLTRPEPIRFRSQADLLAHLVPGRDGVILARGGRRGTFLPEVWETFPEPGVFLEHLEAKAGFAWGRQKSGPTATPPRRSASPGHLRRPQRMDAGGVEQRHRRVPGPISIPISVQPRMTPSAPAATRCWIIRRNAWREAPAPAQAQLLVDDPVHIARSAASGMITSRP